MSPIKQLAVGVGSAFALMASLVAPLWVIELALVGLSLWFLMWVARTSLWRLSSDRRIPRLMVFGPLSFGIVSNLYLVNATGRVALVANLVLFLAALVVGLYRVFRAPFPPVEPIEP